MKIDFQEQLRLEDTEWQKERKRLSKLEWKCVLDTAHREGYAKGYAKGYLETEISIMSNCISLGMSVEKIADVFNVSVEYVNDRLQKSESNKN
jgi:hypothetical protein